MLKIDAVFASSIGLEQHDTVNIQLILDAPKANVINVDPVDENDWEITSANAEVIETLIPQQTRAVKIGQTLIIHVSSSIKAKVKILSFEPRSQDHTVDFAMIDYQNCEFIVAPKERTAKKKVVGTNSLQKHIKSNISLRGFQLPHPLFNLKPNDYNYEVYVNFEHVLPVLQNSEYVNVFVIPGPQSEKYNAEGQVIKPVPAPVKKVVVKLVNDSLLESSVIGLSKIVCISIGVGTPIGELICLETIPPQQQQHSTSKNNPVIIIQSFTLKPADADDDQLTLKNSDSQKEEKLIRLEQQRAEFFHEFYELKLDESILTNGMTLPALKSLPLGGVLSFKDTKELYLKPTNKDSKLKFAIGKEILNSADNIPRGLYSAPQAFKSPIGIDNLLNKIKSCVLKENIGVLIHGAPGSGKTIVTEEISSFLESEGFAKLKLECTEFNKEGYSGIKRRLHSALLSCSWYAPCVLVLENIDSIFPAEVENVDSTQSIQLTEFFIQLVNLIQSSRNLIVLATSKSKESCNKLLFSTNCINEFFSLVAPDKEARRLILTDLISQFELNLHDKFDIAEIVIETEGYLPSDLKVLIERINHEITYKIIENEEKGIQDETVSINSDVFQKAIKGYVPSSLRGVKLQKSLTNWLDIGGLKEAKSILLETLEWPTKYAPIFKSATLRLRSGILLYGYPGCGKTLLASAVAGQCGLNFISVKGPEILNKYIGASEQSVRELFERAQAAKPCILFFDEFDSIAPKRGHDSTGVTDRVVNQMLTQMDGAEGLDGVYVLAATSRPDLIDSALLRPGRLDKSVICDMPNFDDRLDILKSVTRNMNLSSDVDLNEIALKCEGFSGADLQALGYNAYLKAVHEKLERDKLESEGVQVKGKDSGKSGGKVHEFFQLSLNKLKTNDELKPHERSEIIRQLDPLFENLQLEETHKTQDTLSTTTESKANSIIITKDDFIFSLNDTKPSISVSEQLKLQNIYNKFVSARDGKMKDGSGSTEVGARSSLM